VQWLCHYYRWLCVSFLSFTEGFKIAKKKSSWCNLIWPLYFLSKCIIQNLIFGTILWPLSHPRHRPPTIHVMSGSSRAPWSAPSHFSKPKVSRGSQWKSQRFLLAHHLLLSSRGRWIDDHHQHSNAQPNGHREVVPGTAGCIDQLKIYSTFC
jgi:hypothetical protein